MNGVIFKEHGLPGIYIGVTMFSVICSAVLFISGLSMTFMLVLFAIGTTGGVVGLYIWKKIVPHNDLKNVMIPDVWNNHPITFGAVGFITFAIVVSLIVFVPLLLLSPQTLKEGPIAELYALAVFCIASLMGVLTATPLGMLVYAGAEKIINERKKNAAKPKPATSQMSATNGPEVVPAGNVDPQKVFVVLAAGLIGLLILGLIGIAGFFLIQVNVGPKAPLANSAATPTKIVATVMLLPTREVVTTVEPTVMVTPSPTATTTATPTAVLPTVPPVPPPPTGAPIAPPATETVTATVRPPTVTPSRTQTATAAKPTATKSPAPPLVCNYTTVAGDTWGLVAQKLRVTVGALIAKNQGANPAQPGTVLKSPHASCP